MNHFISFRYDICHTHCSVCVVDCFQTNFFLKECGHAYCMKCVNLYYDEIKKDISANCIVCISSKPKGSASKEEDRCKGPHELPPDHTKEASLPP